MYSKEYDNNLKISKIHHKKKENVYGTIYKKWFVIGVSALFFIMICSTLLSNNESDIIIMKTKDKDIDNDIKVKTISLSEMTNSVSLSSISLKTSDSLTDMSSIHLAKIYYVAKNGNDYNPGTFDRPFRTIQKAAKIAIAGDTVYIKEGIYNEKINVYNSGSVNMYITFMAYPGHKVTIEGKGLTMYNWEGLFHINRKSYIKVSGLRIVNSSQAGIHVDNSHHIIVENNYIYNTELSSIKIGWGYSKNIIVSNNTINRPYKNEWSISRYKGWQETISVSNTENIDVKGNNVYNGKGECIDLKDGTMHGNVYKNSITYCSAAGIYLDAFAGYEYDINVYQNNIGGAGSGIMIGSEKGGTISNVKIYNNLIYDSKLHGIYISSYSISGYQPKINNILIINNIVNKNNGGGIDIQRERGYNMRVSNVTIRNNIANNNKIGQILIESGYPYVQNVIIDHNLKYGIKGYFEKDGTHVTYADPQYVNQYIKDFRPKSTAPSIDRGNYYNAPNIDYRDINRPKGSAFDIGAYEYTGKK